MPDYRASRTSGSWNQDVIGWVGTGTGLDMLLDKNSPRYDPACANQIHRRTNPDRHLFLGLAYDHPRLTMEQFAEKVRPDGFGKGPAAKEFRRQAQEVLDLERAK
jgi:hypothetical protein